MSYPITTTELMQHLRFTADASELVEAETMIQSATRFAEMYTGRRFVLETVTEYFSQFPLSSVRPIKPSGGPAESLVSLSYYDTKGTQIAITDSRILFGKVWPARLSEWPTDVMQCVPDAVELVYTTGMAPEAVPSPVKSAILLMASSLWENRENEIVGQNIKSLKPSLAAKDLLHPYKMR